MNDSRRRVFLRFSPFSSLNLSSILFAATLGVVSGVYIFDDLVRNSVRASVEEQKEKQRPSKQSEPQKDNQPRVRLQ